MSSIDLAKTTLNNTKNFLKESKAEIYAMLKDPKVAEWQQISLEKNAPILKTLGISAQELTKFLHAYPKTAKNISKKITQWQNQVGNQLADLVGHKNPDQALKLAQALEKETGAIETLKSSLQLQIAIFIDTDQLIRQTLSLQGLIPVAEKCKGVKSNLFKTGLKILSLISDEVGNDPSQRSINQIHNDANKLATRFSHIDMPPVPRLAEEIIFHHLSVGIETTKEVIAFIEDLQGRLAGETSSLHQIKLAINQLYDQNTSAVLKGLAIQARSFGTVIDGLYHKRQLKNNIEAIDETIELLNIYQLSMKNKLLPDLTESIDDYSSKLNPTSLSAQKTKDFFIGAKGIIRSVKMMMTSLKGHEGINEIELQVILEMALNKCAIFYGKSPKDIQKLHSFIHNLIADFQRPFPYDDLLATTKRTIAAYGTEIEHYIKGYNIPSELKTLTTISIPSTFGGLFKKITEKKAIFHKANNRM